MSGARDGIPAGSSPGITLAGKIFFVDYADNDGTFVYAILSIGRKPSKNPPRLVSGPFMRDRRSALRKLLLKISDDDTVLDAILATGPATDPSPPPPPKGSPP